MRFHSSLIGCLCFLVCLDAAAQFTDAKCPAEVLSVTPNATCAARTKFSFLIFGSMPADTPTQACNIAATILAQNSNIPTACKFDASQDNCNCMEDGGVVTTSWPVVENPDSLMPLCPADFTPSSTMRMQVTTIEGFHTSMPVCLGPIKDSLPPPPPPPVTPQCPVAALQAMKDPAAVQHERGEFAARSDLARLNAAAMAGQACMLDRADKAAVFPVSAFRPAEYQAHLKEVWDKWHGIANNTSPACKTIKDDLRREWLKHKLVRDPQTSLPHASGEAVDIVGIATKTVDATAAYCGMMRPDPVASPLHFQPGRK